MQSEHWFGRLTEALRDHESARLSPASLPPRYEILGDPKAGGMGVVYRAWDRELGREVAIKVLLEEGESPTQAMSRLRREAELAARLSHPNIVAVHDVGTWKENGKPYIVMQYVEGTTLNEAGLQDFRELARVLAKAARAVQGAHEKGVIHRDLKPQNILLDKKGHVFLTDFGLAKDRRSPGAGISEEIVGTPAFMAPEQASGRTEEVDERSDIYALGATLYSLVTGRAPARGTTTAEILADVARGIPPPARKFRPNCPERLERIIGKAMAKNKEERYPSAQDFAEALEAFRRESLLRRHPWAFGMAAAVLVSGLIWLVQARVEAQRASEGARLGEIKDLIAREEFQEAHVRLTSLRPVLGEKDERLRSREEEFRSRLNAALDREASLLFEELWTGRSSATPSIRDRMTRYSPEEGPKSIREAEGEVQELKALAGRAESTLRGREYSRGEKTIREMAGHRFGARAIRSIRAGLLEELRRDLGSPPSRPGEEPAPDLRAGISLLRSLDPQNPSIESFEQAIRLRDSEREAETPGLGSADLLKILARMEEINAKSAFTDVVRRRYFQVQAKERKDLDLRGQLKAFEADALGAFRVRSLERLEEALRQRKEAAQALGDPEAAATRSIWAQAREWLVVFERIWARVPEDPEKAKTEAHALTAESLAEELRSAAKGHLAALQVRIDRERALRTSRMILECSSRGDLGGARRAMGELERISAPGIETELATARRLLLALEDGLKGIDQGRVELGEGKVSDALRAVDRAFEVVPRNPELSNLIVACFERWAAASDAKGFITGYAQLARAGRLDDSGLRARIAPLLDRVATGLSDSAEVWSAALGPLDRVLGADPAAYEVRMERAIIERRLGQLDAALSDIAGVLEARPGQPRALFLRGELRFLKGLHADALKDFELVRRTDPENPIIHYWCGVVRRLDKAPDLALGEFDRATQLGFQGADARYEMARIHFEKKDFGGALGLLTEARRLGTTLSEEERIALKCEARSLAESLRDFGRDVRVLEAEIYLKQARYEECAKACDAALALDPNDAHAHFLKGLSAFKEDRFAAALPDLMKAKAIYERARDDRGVQASRDLIDLCLERKGK